MRHQPICMLSGYGGSASTSGRQRTANSRPRLVMVEATDRAVEAGPPRSKSRNNSENQAFWEESRNQCAGLVQDQLWWFLVHSAKDPKVGT